MGAGSLQSTAGLKRSECSGTISDSTKHGRCTLSTDCRQRIGVREGIRTMKSLCVESTYTFGFDDDDDSGGLNGGAPLWVQNFSWCHHLLLLLLLLIVVVVMAAVAVLVFCGAGQDEEKDRGMGDGTEGGEEEPFLFLFPIPALLLFSD